MSYPGDPGRVDPREEASIMPAKRIYLNPPIIEALCEIHFEDSAWDDTIPGLFYERIREQFPDKRQRDIQRAEVAISPTEARAHLCRLPPWIAVRVGGRKSDAADFSGYSGCQSIAPLSSFRRLGTRELEALFPGLLESEYRMTSDATPDYNCIAWAAGDSSRWWEPDELGLYYWPDGVSRRPTLDAFLEAFPALGSEECEDLDWERGWEKVAVYAKDGRPIHAARQLAGGSWSSKL